MKSEELIAAVGYLYYYPGREAVFSLDLYDLLLPVFSQKMSMALVGLKYSLALVWLHKNNEKACHDKGIGFND